MEITTPRRPAWRLSDAIGKGVGTVALVRGKAGDNRQIDQQGNRQHGRNGQCFLPVHQGHQHRRGACRGDPVGDPGDRRFARASTG